MINRGHSPLVEGLTAYVHFPEWVSYLIVAVWGGVGLYVFYEP